VTITTSGLRNKLPGRDDISMSAPAQARPGKTNPMGRQAGRQRDGDRPRHTPHPTAFRHFLTCMGWSDSKHPHTPLEAYLWLGFICGLGSASGRHFLVFVLIFFFFFFFFFGIPLLSPRARSPAFLLRFHPHHGRVLGRISDCIYSTEGGDTGDFGYWFKKEDAAMQPNLGRDRGQRHPFFFSLFLPPFLGWIPVGTRLRRLVIMIPPACVSGHIASTLSVFPFSLVFFLSHG